MAWQTLDEATARSWGVSCAEELIQVICAGCPKGNLDFEGDEFCEVQAHYGFDGEHPSIQHQGHKARCTEFERLTEAEREKYEKRMRGDWS